MKTQKALVVANTYSNTRSVLRCRINFVRDDTLRMDFDLINRWHDSGNINYSLGLENIKIGETCVDSS
jgi:hypothetical protein